MHNKIRKAIQQRAKELRENLTETEKALRGHLRKKQIEKCKFRRQEPIGRFIVDFVCYENKLIIEVDGGQHAIAKEKDIERDKWLQCQGFTVLRFWNNDVLMNMEGTLEIIRRFCIKRFPLTPSIKGGASKEAPSVNGQGG